MHESWALACVVGFWGWVLSTIGLIIKAFPSASAFAGKAAAMWGGAVIIFYLLWFMGMINT